MLARQRDGDENLAELPGGINPFESVTCDLDAHAQLAQREAVIVTSRPA
jgi:hypothetical protein